MNNAVPYPTVNNGWAWEAVAMSLKIYSCRGAAQLCWSVFTSTRNRPSFFVYVLTDLTLDIPRHKTEKSETWYHYNDGSYFAVADLSSTKTWTGTTLYRIETTATKKMINIAFLLLYRNEIALWRKHNQTETVTNWNNTCVQIASRLKGNKKLTITMVTNENNWQQSPA